jgi:3-deoxy-D-manno-octulosonic-acid transferase
MPCSDGGWNDEVRVNRDMVKEHNMLEAAMCGVLTVLEGRFKEGSLNELLNMVEWEEAGIKRKTLEMWWKAHKKKDEERRDREDAARRKEELRASALSKLSPAERAVLGIK